MRETLAPLLQRGRPSWPAVLDLGRWTPDMTTRALGLVQRVPRPLLDAGAAVGAAGLGVRPNGPMRQWQRNVELATGRRPDASLTARGGRLWARNLLDSALLAGWGPDRIERAVTIDADDWQRLRHAFGTTGAVLALPHTGSWDLAGAWVCGRGLPVTSVAENMDADEFAFFAAERARMGMRILAHDDPRLGAELLADQRGGRMVCLLMDRDLSRWGTRVQWPTPGGPRTVRVPNGAARIALDTGATLFAVVPHYTPGGMHISISQPVTAPPGTGRVRSMCQQLVEEFARAVAAHPDDWHMLVPFFPGDTSTRAPGVVVGNDASATPAQLRPEEAS